MAELTISQLIKIILGVFVIAVVAIGLYFFFTNYVMEFFKSAPGAEEVPKAFLSLLK